MKLLDLEKALHHEVARCLDHLMARVIQAAHFGEELLDQVSDLVALKPHIRMQDRGQSVKITLLGGTQVEIVSPYMLQRPKKRRGRKRTKRGKSGNGFYRFLSFSASANVSPRRWPRVWNKRASRAPEQPPLQFFSLHPQTYRRSRARILCTLCPGALSTARIARNVSRGLGQILTLI